MITFEPIANQEIKQRTGMTIYDQVIIKKDAEIVGRIFTPAGTTEDINNAIQICGFTEAFDLWGCGIHHGYKDIQLLFDEGIMGGKINRMNLRDCCKCFRKPCQCENKVGRIPFNVKSSFDEVFRERLERKAKEAKQ